MLAFEIEIDGKPFCIAGIEDWAVLAFILDANRQDSREDITLSMGGMTERNDEGVAHHVRWGNRKVGIATRVVLTVVETDEPDPPLRRYRSDRDVQECPFTAEEIEERERVEWLRLKAKFEPCTIDGNASSRE